MGKAVHHHDPKEAVKVRVLCEEAKDMAHRAIRRYEAMHLAHYPHPRIARMRFAIELLDLILQEIP